MDSLGIPWRDEDGTLLKIPVPSMTDAMRNRWIEHEWKEVNSARGRSVWVHEPSAVRAAPASFRSGFKKLTYQQWFATDFVRRESLSFHLCRREHVRTVCQFRLGSFSWLNIQAGRQGRHSVPRHERFCPCCKDKIEDEAHVLECPLYADVWLQAGLFETPQEGWDDRSIHAAFNYTSQVHWVTFADALVRCMDIRMKVCCAPLQAAR